MHRQQPQSEHCCLTDGPIHCLKHLQSCENDASDNRETAWTAFVGSIKASVPVEAEGSVIDVNDVDGGNPEFNEGQMIVFHPPGVIEKVPRVTETVGLCKEQFVQPRS
jgi:hypothetical protein